MTLQQSPAPRNGRESPLDALNQLTSADWRILDELLYLQQRFNAVHPERNPYCTPGQAYLAAKTGISREHVSRRTSALADLGLIRKIVRRKRHGRWSTCLYTVATAVKWRINRLLTRLKKGINRVINTSHIANPFKTSSSTPGAVGAYLTRFAAGNPYPPP